MKSWNIHEAKTHLSRLVDAAAAGEEIVIAKAGKPVAKLVPVSAASGARKLGALAGKVHEAPDCWEPDPEIEDLFYGGAIEPARARRVAEGDADPRTGRAPRRTRRR
ncbi:MAG TPA: type II toxin-antitoxin system prevent-host-death family antitoxin [Gemmatimonadaceae bacterium]|nr:type II toxin-antitoxin system prevent-host-death family antitoxin [Gemmatimonadaceae bacterium]